ncbi:MAG: hypothetical protein LR015_02225 [Verrucomicrobia bacterium]|nr:hypothetical protein [Verrucomicrobiota bacterium]
MRFIPFSTTIIVMSLVDLEKEVESLAPADFEAFTKWLDALAAKRWDAQFESDVAAGKLDRLGMKADIAFESGSCKEL